jgi:hypothetical protein
MGSAPFTGRMGEFSTLAVRLREQLGMKKKRVRAMPNRAIAHLQRNARYYEG